MLGVITDDDGRVPVRCGEDFLVLLGDQADAGGAIQRLQGGVELGPRGVGKHGAKPGEADPSAGPRRESGIGMSNEVFGRRLVVIGSEHIGEAEVGAAQVAM